MAKQCNEMHLDSTAQHFHDSDGNEILVGHLLLEFLVEIFNTVVADMSSNALTIFLQMYLFYDNFKCTVV